MSYSNSLTASRYADFEAASAYSDYGDACDSFIRAYQPDHRTTVPAQTGLETPCEIAATGGTSFIRLVPRCRSAHVAAPGGSVITITGSDMGTFLVDLPTMLHNYSLVDAYLRLAGC